MSALGSYQGRMNPVSCIVGGCRRPSWRDDALCPIHEIAAGIDAYQGHGPAAPGGEPGPPARRSALPLPPQEALRG